MDTEESRDQIELIEALLAANQHAFSPNTRHVLTLRSGGMCAAASNYPLREITASQLRMFLDATVDLAPTMLARRKTALRSRFSLAYQQDLLDADPTAKLEAILAAIPRNNVRNRLLLTLLYETGMRVGEALGLQVQQVHLNDLDGGYLRIVGKGNKDVIFYHETELPIRKMMVDTTGFTELMYALYDLQGLI